MKNPKWVFGSVIFAVVLCVGLTVEAGFPQKPPKDYSKISKVAKICMDSVQLSEEESNMVKNLEPIIQDSFCCSQFFGKKLDRFDCLRNKSAFLDELLYWLMQTFNKGFMDALLNVCESAGPLPGFGGCSTGFPALTGEVGDEEIEKAIESIKCALKQLDIHINDFMLGKLGYIQGCSKK